MGEKLRERPHQVLFRIGLRRHLQRQCFVRFEPAVNVVRDGRLGPNPMPVVRTSAAARLYIDETTTLLSREFSH
jgi:hypothetical protein